MSLSFIKQHILRSIGSIAEAIADIEAKPLAFMQAGSRTPVPGILVGPDTPAPVQSAKAVLLVKTVFFCVEFHFAAGRHAVDLLVVIEMNFGLLVWCRDDHRIIIHLL